MQGTSMNKNIPVLYQASGVHGGHIQSRHYSSEGADKRIYTFCIISHFIQVIYYLNVKYICISSTNDLLLSAKIILTFYEINL